MRIERGWMSAVGIAALTVASQHALAAGADVAATANIQPCSSAGLKLPAGFCATVFADDLGSARHIAVAANGVVYVNTWSGRYYRCRRSPPTCGR